MKLVFVTPRYGTEVIGGAETAARMLAERMCQVPGWEVEVLTSCALDHLTWENTEPAGTSVWRSAASRLLLSRLALASCWLELFCEELLPLVPFDCPAMALPPRPVPPAPAPPVPAPEPAPPPAA